MTIGAGIAIAGAWGFAAACAFAPAVTSRGFNIATAAALIATVVVAVAN